MSEVTESIVATAANGNKSAEEFCRSFLQLAHSIDDIVDKVGKPEGEFVLQTFMKAIMLFTTNTFFIENRLAILPLVLTSLNVYATSVSWEKDPDARRRASADHLRSSGLRVIEFVALMCGGVANMRNITPKLLDDSWATHHDKEGRPI